MPDEIALLNQRIDDLESRIIRDREEDYAIMKSKLAAIESKLVALQLDQQHRDER